MEQINNTTLLIGIKDKNITLDKTIQHDTHIEVIATLDHQPPKCKRCKETQIKYNFQKPSKISFIDIWGFPSLIRLKKRRRPSSPLVLSYKSPATVDSESNGYWHTKQKSCLK
ncbi:transposase [Streptococcus equi subsp. zooepidemicus]|nr:transposase [Streptococcus equi subsp. zooepidemicus]